MMAERRVHFISAVEEANAQPDPQLTPRVAPHVAPFPAIKPVKNGQGATMATGAVKDALPVVELKPFFNQVWRREKSLPDFYAKAASSAKAAQTPAPPDPLRATIQSEPSPAVVSLYRDVTGLLWKDVSPRVQAERSEVNTRNGPRGRAHPPVEYSYNCLPKRSGGYIPEFIPRQGRAKSTMEETRRDDSVTRLYSCVKHALTSEMLARQQEIRVDGGRMRQSLQRRQLLYLNPLYMYRGGRGGYEGGYPLEKGSLSSPGAFRRHDPDGFYKGHDSPQYSHRSPSRPQPSPRKSYTGDETPSTHGSRRPPYPGRSEAAGSPRRPFRLHTKIGVAKDSLKILSESGPPTSVERQLTLQMEIDLERFRKLRQKELSPVDAPPGPPKPYPSLASGLTRGELELQKGREANKQHRAREKAKKSFKEVAFHRLPQDLALTADNPLPDPLEFTYRSGKGGGEQPASERRSHVGELPPLDGCPGEEGGPPGAGEGLREDKNLRDLRDVAAEHLASQDHRGVIDDVIQDADDVIRERPDPDYAPAPPGGSQRSSAHAPKQPLPVSVLDPQEDEGRSSDDDIDDEDDVTSVDDDQRDVYDGDGDDEGNDKSSDEPPSGTSSTATPNVPPESSNRVDVASSPMKFHNESPDTGIGVNGESEAAAGKDIREESGNSKLSKESRAGCYKSTTFITNSQRDVAT